MKKYFLAIFLIPLFFTNVKADNWNIQSNMGYNYIPGKYYYRENVGSYDNGTSISSFWQQGTVETPLYLFPIRFAFTRKFGLVNLGVETGLDISLVKTISAWIKPDIAGYSGTTRFPYLKTYSTSAEMTLRNELVTWAIPLLLKTDWDLFKLEKLSLNLGFSVGEYILVQTINSTLTFEYKQTAGTYNVGDKEIMSEPSTYAVINTIIELCPNLTYKLTDEFLINVLIKLGYIPVFSNITSINPSDKTGYEFGGLTYGVGLGASVKF